jgi:hypothetical protein
MKKTVLLTLVVLLAPLVLAQNSTLHNYTWKSRTQVEMGGEVKSVVLEQVRTDSSGQVQKTPLSAPPAAPSQRGPVRRRLAQRKTERTKEWMQGLQATLAPYQSLPPEKLKAFAEGATKQPVGDGLVQLQGRGLVQPDDQVVLTVEMVSHQPRKMQVKTTYDGSPVELQVELSAIAPNVTAPVKVVTTVPDDGLNITTDNYDYQQLRN